MPLKLATKISNNTLQNLVLNCIMKKSNPFYSLLLCVCVSTNLNAQTRIQGELEKQHTELYQTMLVGGSLSTCSSFSKRHCLENNFSADQKSSMLYEISNEAIDRLENFMKIGASLNTQKTLMPVVSQLHKMIKKGPLSRDELFDNFESYSLDSMVNGLEDSAYFALLDHLEFAQINKNGERKKEIANVEQSKLKSSVAIYSAFVEQVEKRALKTNQAAHILVVTASSRDAFEVADFYTSAFSSLGIKTTWLPIDASLADALDARPKAADACARLSEYRKTHNLFDRERIYPEYTRLQQHMCEQPEQLLALIDSAQGIFINGGDQSKTLAALRSSNGQFAFYWQRVLAKVESFDMIVGGTSAGAAVQAGNSYAKLPIPMISNGSSTQAIKRGAFAAFAPSQRCTSDNCEAAIGSDDLTYMPTGGAGLFTVGTVDTHFSERDREGRLIALAGSQSVRLAVGVDEATAMFFKKIDEKVHLQILGENGVFIVDGYNAMQKQSVSLGVKNTQYAGFAHYLSSGVEATLDLLSNDWTLSNNVTLLDERKTLAALDNGVWRNNTRKYCGTSEPISWDASDVNYVLAPSTKTRFFIDSKKKYCGYLFLPFIVSG